MTKHELISTQTLRNGARVTVERHTTPDEVRYLLTINSGAAGSTRIYVDAAELRDLQAAINLILKPSDI